MPVPARPAGFPAERATAGTAAPSTLTRAQALRTGGTVMALGLAVAQLNRVPDTSNALVAGGILWPF